MDTVSRDFTMPGHKASLRLSLWDAFFYSLMIGAGETYLPAHALSVGMSEWLTGLFATVPLMTGALIQLLSPWLLVHVRSPKKWVVGAVVFQAFVFLPLFYLSIKPSENFFWLFLLASLYWGANFASGPAWNFWMQQLVPEATVAHFFALRQRVCQMGILVGLMGGGWALHAHVTIGPFQNVFSLLFLFAFVCRLCSGFFLSQKKEETIQNIPRPEFKELFSLWTIPEYRSFFGFLFVFYLVMSVSSPFVTPYFLQKLHLNYSDYMFSLASLLTAKILILPFAGTLVRKFGSKRVFFWGVMGVSPLPMLWPLSHSLPFVMGLQAVSGAFWGLFEVSLAVAFFNHIKAEQKILILTLYNFFNSAAVILGSLLGGEILKNADADLTSYYFIFVFGGALRVAVGGWYAFRIRNQKNLLGAEHIEESEPSFSGALPKEIKAG